MIASRWPVTAVPIPEELRGKIPWPQLLGHAAIDVEGRQAHVITAHIPNGSGNGWAKIDTFHGLAEIMRSLKGQPCILTGDFNEPRYALQDGKIVTFGQDRRSNGRYTCWSHWSFNGERRAGEEWDKAVRWFFEVQNNHGLRHAFWAACGRCKTAVTHRSHGSPRWFDHIFVSDDFEVRTCTYIHDVRLKGFSDHSALVTQLAVRKNNALH